MNIGVAIRVAFRATGSRRVTGVAYYAFSRCAAVPGNLHSEAVVVRDRVSESENQIELESPTKISVTASLNHYLERMQMINKFGMIFWIGQHICILKKIMCVYLSEHTLNY